MVTVDLYPQALCAYAHKPYVQTIKEPNNIQVFFWFVGTDKQGF
jgi:hypothetical protein